MKDLGKHRLNLKQASSRLGAQFFNFLARPRVGQVLLFSAGFSGGLAVSMSAAVYVGLLPDLSSKKNLSTAAEKPAALEASQTESAPIKLPAPPPALAIRDALNEDTYLRALLGEINGVGFNEQTISADESITPEYREMVLKDYDHRISDEFNIPDGIRDRVGFWFDVYTKYDANRRVIHHSEYPWIIFKVVDVTDIINSDTPKRRWMRNQKADRLVDQEKRKIIQALRAIGNGKSEKKFNDTEQMVAEALSSLKGSLKKNARQAAQEVRTQVGQKNHFMEGLEVSPRYLSAMEKIFQAHNLPLELTRLPFVESSFNKKATSHVGAAGIWQFMGNTGRKFMIVNDAIDERRSPFKATEAAARLLKENHLILHRSWPLAITAWNHGPGGVRRAMKAVGSRDISKIVNNYRSRSFDFASSNFYSEFLAALYAERYHENIYGGLKKEKPIEVNLVKLRKSIRVKSLLKQAGLTEDEFLNINPDLRKAAKINSLLPAGFKLNLNPALLPSLGRILALAEVQNSRLARALNDDVAEM